MGGSLAALKKIGRLWGVYARLDLLLMTRDWKTFAGWALSDSIGNVATIMGMLLLAERFNGIGAWSKYQILFLLGYTSLADGVLSIFFSYNVMYISRRLGRGQFDHTLIQPQPIWMSLLTEGFSPVFGIPMALPGLGILLWALPHLPVQITPLWVGMLCLNLVASVVLLMAYQFCWGSLAFWSPRSAEEINSATLDMVTHLKPYPLDGLGGVLTTSFLTLLPIGFLAWVPSRYLAGVETTPWNGGATSLAAIAFAFVAWRIFRKGLQHYGRVGAQGYSNFGHRG